jgi:hypothetical protein
MKHVLLGVVIAASLLACGGTSLEPQTTEPPRTLLGSTPPSLANPISIEASILALHQTAFGRDADVSGLDYWMDLGRAGATLEQIATAFTHLSEFAPIAQKSNEAFVQGLYLNAYGREGDAADIAFWVAALSGGASRAGLILQFSRNAV